MSDGELADRVGVSFRPHLGGRAFEAFEAFEAGELRGAADLRLYVLEARSWEAHVGASHPTLGTGRDRRVPITP